MSGTISRQHLLSSPELVDRCHRRLRETADGGDACLDKGGLVAGVESLRLPAAATGFPGWHRDPGSAGDEPGPRGDAAWLWPTDVCAGGGARPAVGPWVGPRILFLHGGSYTYCTGLDALFASASLTRVRWRKAPLQ